MNSSNARDELEKLVVGNRSRIDLERVKKADPKLQVEDDEDLLRDDEDLLRDDEDLLREFVQTNHPGNVLLDCFYEYDLQKVAVEQLEIKKEQNLRGRKLVGAILEWCGFPKEEEPIGLFQIREEFNLILKSAAAPRLQDPASIDGFFVTMGKAMEKLLPVLFLFHIGMSRRETENKEAIEKLCGRYRNGRKSLGCYIGFKGQEEAEDKDGYLTALINIVQNDNKLKDYYRKYFKYETPLTQSHIAEFGMLVIYRNLIAHDWDYERWQGKKSDGETNLSKMDQKALEHWQENWNSIVEAVESQPQQPTFPKPEMLQKVVIFLQEFLDLLSENQIYPKVIVMISSTVDNYGTHHISANSSDPNDETIFLTNCKFTPHIQFYYHSRANRVGIDPLLVSKEDLENWAIPSDDNTENQKEE